MKIFIRNLTVFLLITVSTFIGFAQTEKKESSNSMISYEKLLPQTTKTQVGLFKFHEVDGKYFLEIGDSILGKDMLFASRISEVSENNRIEAGRMLRNPILICFTYTNGNIFIRMPQSVDILKDENQNLKSSFQRNNISPVMESFQIKAISPDSSSYVIDVTKLFSEEIKYVDPFDDKFKFGKFESTASFIEKADVFSNNLEVSSYLSYSASTKPFLAKINRSIVLLPDKPMPMRLHDERIGFYPLSKRIYTSASNRLESTKFIKRWRVQPKPEDLQKYFDGELVEPEKPIVFYIDNSFPDEWKPFLKEGVESWQKTFEEIGFKNAIQAKFFPENDPDFRSEDIRYSCIRYITSPTANAMGPSWIDPRSGEIIQGDVLFYHNVIKLIHDWRFVQTAAVDTAARRKIFSTELMGELIRYVIAHEIGHTLGQEHNMRGSYAYPVDSLRSPGFTEKFGTTASIMDYARNNYVAQPGDGVKWLSPPVMGPYDYFSIKYAYKLIPGCDEPSDEKATLQRWITEMSNDPVFVFGEQSMGIPIDPASQQEAIGDDALAAGRYGIANTKLIMQHLIEWTADEGEGFAYSRQIYEELMKQYGRYINHALAYVGGCHIYPVVHGQNNTHFVPVPKEKQKDALRFVFEQFHDQSGWIVSDDLEQRIGFVKNKLFEEQLRTLDWLMGPSAFSRFELYGKFANEKEKYSIAEYLDDLHSLVWDKSISEERISDFEKILLAGYVNNLKGSWNKNSEKKTDVPDDFNEDWIGNSVDMSYSIERSNSLKEIKFSDLTIEPLISKKLEETRSLLRKLCKSGAKVDREFYEYLLNSI